MTKSKFKIGLILLTLILLGGILVGYYGSIGLKTIIDIFVIPSFIIAAVLTFTKIKAGTD